MRISMAQAAQMSEQLAVGLRDLLMATDRRQPSCFAGIPRGGLMVAVMMEAAYRKYRKDETLVFSADDVPSTYAENVVLCDDVLTTGKTMSEAAQRFDTILAGAVLVSKNFGSPATLTALRAIESGEWVEFPWEAREQGGKPLDAVTRLIEYAGDDPTRDGLLETPERVLKYLDEQRIGEPYEATAFKSDITDLQVEKGIPFGSMCEHHMLPFFGTALVGYIPNGKLLGLSKLVRITADHCRGFTMQEVMTAQVASAVQEAAGTPDVAVITTAQHTCMIVRGVKAPGSSMSSAAMLGKFRDAPALRAEFMALAGIS